MILLFLTIGMLAIAPLIYQLASHYRRTWQVVEKITSWSIGFMVIFLLLPECVHQAGFPVLLATLFGLVLPSLFERLWRAQASSIHLVSITFSLVGLIVHAMLDGAALTMGGSHLHHHHEHSFIEIHALPLAVVLHQLPVGLFIWGLFHKKYGAKVPSIILIISILATILGYALGEEYLEPIHDHELLAYFQALFCGTLLHVVFDTHGTHDHHDHSH